jgi:hypothetical protein
MGWREDGDHFGPREGQVASVSPFSLPPELAASSLADRGKNGDFRARKGNCPSRAFSLQKSGIEGREKGHRSAPSSCPRRLDFDPAGPL